MKSSLLMNFTADKENSRIKVEREFAAPLAKVWAAWTDHKILDQWWAPKPYKARTKSQDFKVGGRWLYAMVAPDGAEHWALGDYLSINPQKSFSVIDAFSDSNGNLNKDFPRSTWTNTFRESGNSTFVTIVIQYDKLEDLEKIISLGMKEGFTMALENLDEVLA